MAPVNRKKSTRPPFYHNATMCSRTATTATASTTQLLTTPKSEHLNATRHEARSSDIVEENMKPRLKMSGSLVRCAGSENVERGAHVGFRLRAYRCRWKAAERFRCAPHHFCHCGRPELRAPKQFFPPPLASEPS